MFFFFLINSYIRLQQSRRLYTYIFSESKAVLIGRPLCPSRKIKNKIHRCRKYSNHTESQRVLSVDRKTLPVQRAWLPEQVLQECTSLASTRGPLHILPSPTVPSPPGISTVQPFASTSCQRAIRYIRFSVLCSVVNGTAQKHR